MNREPEQEARRRLRVFYVSEGAILGLFSWRHAAFLSLPEINLPDGARIERVAHVWDRSCFAFLISHPSFEVVPMGEMPPAEDIAFSLIALVDVPITSQGQGEDKPIVIERHRDPF